MVSIQVRKIISIAVIVGIVLVGIAFLFLIFSKGEPVPEGPTSEEIAKAKTLAEQKRLLATPEALSMTPDTYASEVARLSVETDTIFMGTECSIDPLIIKMKEGSILKIDNKDSVEHVLAFEDQNFFAVAGGQVREINITEVFGKGEGIYRYRCGDISQEVTVGIMYVVK